MGLLRWFRGDDEAGSTSMMSAGLAEIAGIFQPTRHKQTEHIDETTRRRVDVGNGTGVDLDRGIAVIRLGTPPAPAAAPSTTPTAAPSATPATPAPEPASHDRE